MVDPITAGLAIGAMGAGSAGAGAALGAGAAGAASAGLGTGLGTAALGAAASGAASGIAGGLGGKANGTLTSPDAAPAAPQQQQQPSTMAPKAKSARPSFFGENATPAVGQFGQKTLLGQ